MSDNKKSNGIFKIVIASLVIIGLVKWFRPQTIPFDFFHFWKTGGSIIEAVKNSWLLFAWGAGLSTVLALRTYNDPDDNRDAEGLFVCGVLSSAWAGIAEEICFRWLIFYAAIPLLKLVNFLFFGFLGFGVYEWVYMIILIPVANLVTLDYLRPILFNGYGWAVGAAIVCVNGKFRDAHAHMGRLAWVNAWFCGMFLFYLMFNYGLPAAIIVHFLYNLFIDIINYIDAVIERRLGWV